MGVSGAGKTAVGMAIARMLGSRFIDADDLHPASNREKMRRGVPLEDSDRLPWLHTVGRTLGQRNVVVACSALRRSYRDVLRRGGTSDLVFVYLMGPRQLIASRLAVRSGHFMPPELLDSQFQALEDPVDESDVIAVRIDSSPDEIAAAATTLMRRRGRTS